MTQDSVPAPSIKLTSFACPSCGAHATQTWFAIRLQPYTGDDPVPIVWSLQEIEEHEAYSAEHGDRASREMLADITARLRRLLQREPFVTRNDNTLYQALDLENVFVSVCYTCSQPAIWLHDALLYPSIMTGPAPNPDLSEDVMHDYNEARTILDLSPRGAAALLRLAVEKICIELNANGNTMDQRIADLVAKGLPDEVQQALDTVRVIGNESVHPGQMDLRDDRETASTLFDLVNFIAADRISRPKQIEKLYGMLPETKRKAIAARDAKPADKKK